MPLQDGLAAQQMEVLLDMHAKKLIGELRQLREEIAAVREDLRKGLQSSARDAQAAPPAQYASQFAAPPGPQPMQQQGWGQPAPQQQGWQQQMPPPQQWQQQAPPAQQAPRGYPQQQSQPAPLTHPIDRNGVAPSDVSIDKFFNFSGGGRK